ncbi:hypothetical protein AZ602_06625 [Moraxella sp. RCAD0137]|nr:hypothetical protein AZ602_06625 [Moraxella sp. RCAD0137]
MILLDGNNQEVEVLSQYLISNHTDTVYNIEVDDFHTYHVGRLGVWVQSMVRKFSITSMELALTSMI